VARTAESVMFAPWAMSHTISRETGVSPGQTLVRVEMTGVMS
jgi:hypothetical protein